MEFAKYVDNLLVRVTAIRSFIISLLKSLEEQTAEKIWWSFIGNVTARSPTRKTLTFERDLLSKTLFVLLRKKFQKLRRIFL